MGIMLIALALSIGAASGVLFAMRPVADGVGLLGRVWLGGAARPDDSQQACNRRTLYAIGMSCAGIMFAGGAGLFFQGVKRSNRQ